MLFQQSQLVPLSTRYACNVLHIRTTEIPGEDDFQAAKDLAGWAFNPQGLPELRMLAYGQFDEHSKLGGCTYLACRSERSSSSGQHFQDFTQFDEQMWNYAQKHLESLSASIYQGHYPVDPLADIRDLLNHDSWDGR